MLYVIVHTLVYLYLSLVYAIMLHIFIYWLLYALFILQLVHIRHKRYNIEWSLLHTDTPLPRYWYVVYMPMLH